MNKETLSKGFALSQRISEIETEIDHWNQSNIFTVIQATKKGSSGYYPINPLYVDYQAVKASAIQLLTTELQSLKLQFDKL